MKHITKRGLKRLGQGLWCVVAKKTTSMRSKMRRGLG